MYIYFPLAFQLLTTISSKIIQKEKEKPICMFTKKLTFDNTTTTTTTTTKKIEKQFRQLHSEQMIIKTIVVIIFFVFKFQF